MRVDDFVEQVGGLIVEGKIADFVNAKQSDIGVGAQLLTPCLPATAGAVLPAARRRSGTEPSGQPARRCGRASKQVSSRLILELLGGSSFDSALNP
jgi:hypothetical protein